MRITNESRNLIILKRKKSLILLSVLLVLNMFCSKKEQKYFAFKKHLEQTTVPKLFMPGIVTKRNLRHFGSSSSQDGKYVVYTISDRKSPSKIVTQSFENGKFKKPELIVKDTFHSYADASFSLDGMTITLTSTLPQKGALDDNFKNGIWQFYKEGDNWGKP